MWNFAKFIKTDCAILRYCRGVYVKIVLGSVRMLVADLTVGPKLH